MDVNPYTKKVYDDFYKSINNIVQQFSAIPDSHKIYSDVANVTTGCGDDFVGYPQIIEHKFKQKGIFCAEVARAIPTPDAIASIAFFADNVSVLEINCHRGLWAGLLRLQLHVPNVRRCPTVDILAPYQSETQKTPFVKPLSTTGPDQFEQIEKMYGTIFLVKPSGPKELAFAHKCITTYTGSKIVYVGEKNDDTYNLLMRECDDPDYGDIPSWFDSVFYIFFFKKK